MCALVFACGTAPRCVQALEGCTLLAFGHGGDFLGVLECGLPRSVRLFDIIEGLLGSRRQWTG